MQTVKIDKARLLETVRANKALHEQEYDEAMEGYREEYVKQLAAKRKALKKGELPQQGFTDLPVPSKHTDEYEQVEKMLDFSVDETVELEHSEFSNYVMDDWGWKRHFSATTMNYKK